MYGAAFGDKRSKDDYGAVMNYARITPPSVKENYVDIAGGNSSIDLTEAVGGVVFEDGEIDFKFTLFDPDKKEQMKNDLHGNRMKIVLDREPEFYYEGRVSVTSEKQTGNIYELCMKAKVKPYKMKKLLVQILDVLVEYTPNDSRSPHGECGLKSNETGSTVS